VWPLQPNHPTFDKPPGVLAIFCEFPPNSTNRYVEFASDDIEGQHTKGHMDPVHLHRKLPYLTDLTNLFETDDYSQPYMPGMQFKRKRSLARPGLISQTTLIAACSPNYSAGKRQQKHIERLWKSLCTSGIANAMPETGGPQNVCAAISI